MRLTVQKRLASQILNCSEKKVWVDPERLEEIREAITKQDLRDLVARGLISRKRPPQHSRGRARINIIQKRKGRRRGIGKRKGMVTARNPKKTTWIARVRAQRLLLMDLREKGIVDRKACSDLLKKIKGGFFRSRRHIKLYLSEHKLLKLKSKKEKKQVEKKPVMAEKKPVVEKAAEGKVTKVVKKKPKAETKKIVKSEK